MPHAERSDPWLVVAALGLAIVLFACRPAVGGSSPDATLGGGSGPGLTVVDCGSFEADHDDYDTRGHDCVWDAYSAGRPVRYSVGTLTIEGDRIPFTLSFEPGRGIVVTQDVTGDNFSAQADRRVWWWSCAAMAKTPWPADPSRFYFELSGCSGDGPTAFFP